MASFTTKKISTPPPPKNQKIDLSNALEKNIPSRRGKRILTILLTLFAVGFVVIFGMQIFYRVTDISVLRDTSGSGSEPEFVADRKLEQVNILLAGIGGKYHQGGTLTDTIILASIDGERKTVTMLSIPRDLLVALPQGGAGKINQIYATGNDSAEGIKNLKEKVTEITGESIDRYLVIDFEGFAQVVDILGGIEVDVPEDLVDRAYPDWNYGYEVFSIAKGPQVLNGSTALKYVRSRHSTSDFDRSLRQQLVLQAIRDKVFSLGYLTNPQKIGETVDAVQSHIDTDLSLTDLANLGYNVKDIDSARILSFNLSEDCGNIRTCQPGSYLYTPLRDLVGGASVLLPDGATATRVSQYDTIRRFSEIIFRFGEISKYTGNIHIVNESKVNFAGYNTALGLAKMGFPLAQSGTIMNGSGVSERTRVHIFWDSATQTGIDPEGPEMLALKKIMPNVEITQEPRNLYLSGGEPSIEIILGRNYQDVLSFARVTPTPVQTVAPTPSSSTASSSTSSSSSATPSSTAGTATPPPSSTSTEVTSESTTPTNTETQNTPPTSGTDASTTVPADTSLDSAETQSARESLLSPLDETPQQDTEETQSVQNTDPETLPIQ